MDGWLPNLLKQTLTACEFTEGATFPSSDFVEVCIKEVKKSCLVGIDQVFCCDQCFLDFGEGFCEYSMSDFFTVIFQEPKTLCFIGIHQVFCSDQCLLEFG